MTRSTLRLGVELDDGLLDAERLVELVRLTERGGFDFVAIDDDLHGPDALLALARVAPVTTSIGLLATVTTTHTEPFHVAKNLATLDMVSGGRAGWRVAVSITDRTTRLFGRKGVAPVTELWAEADDTIEVVGRLWDSWEDDAIIRDGATGRYIDRDKLHYVDFEGPFFSVRGPSITPRPPQGQPVVAIADDGGPATAIAVSRADIVIIDAGDVTSGRQRCDDIRRRVASAGRHPDSVAVLANMAVGQGDGVLADVLESWFHRGGVDGFVLTGSALALGWFVEEVGPELAARKLRPAEPDGATLRERFGLTRPANRYAAALGPT